MNEDTLSAGLENKVEISAGGTEAGSPPPLLSLSPSPTKGGDNGLPSSGGGGGGGVSLNFSNQLDSNLSTTASTVTTNKGKGQLMIVIMYTASENNNCIVYYAIFHSASYRESY